MKSITCEPGKEQLYWNWLKHSNWLVMLIYYIKLKKERPPDLDTVYCNCDKANKELLWYAKKSIENICEDSYNFVKNTN